MKNLLSIRSYRTTLTCHSHEFNQLVLPLRGIIDIKVESFSGKVVPRECVIVRSGEQHQFTAEPQARFLVADRRCLPEHISQSKHVVFEINKPLLAFLSFVESQLEYELNCQLEEVMYQTFYLLLEKQRLLPKLDPRINNALLYLEQNIATPLTISTLSQIAFLSPTQFKKAFKKQLGFTPLEYITKIRMEKAQALLTHTDYSLQLIGEHVGYKTLSTFSRKFKQYHGLSPKHFK